MDGITKRETGYYLEDQCDLMEFTALIEAGGNAAKPPNADELHARVPVYDTVRLRSLLDKADDRRALMAEWAQVLGAGAGVLVLRKALPDLGAIDAATAVFEDIVAREKAASGNGADHFAAAGSNDRIWNALQKLCLASPETFVRYFAAPAIDAVCEAWLGPAYQMTAQINVVHPGGQPQQAHRDYHLGFQTAEVSASYPAHVHDLSPLMTLQGGIAHCDMIVESGPTKLLPFSQLYKPGYAAWRRPDFRAYFEANFVQLPLSKGDAIFFNPALFHAAGENRTADVHRMVNLLQISSPFGRAMESVDRLKMCTSVFEPLKKMWRGNVLAEPELDAVIASTAEGYAFPTNLDRDPPVGGLAPQSQQSLLKEAVLQGWDGRALGAKLNAQAERQRP